MKNKLEWEMIFKSKIGDATKVTHRAKIPGGWLVKSIDIYTNFNGINSMATGLTFVPDAEYNWK